MSSTLSQNPPNPLWTELAGKAEVQFNAAQLNQLCRYLDLLEEANRRMNLTRIIDRTAAEIGHVADSLTVLPFLPKGSIKLADVGSGGGVPGIPLAIARPNAVVVLIESTKKKAMFLKETATALGLTNVKVLDDRVEDVGRGMDRETFDIAVVRAVATMNWLAEWCLPLLKIGGKMLAMKGERISEELPEAKLAIRRVGGGMATVHSVQLPGSEHHVIVEVPKAMKTDELFPRPATVAKGRSL
jgi:16S rRNA (guanine527-N7)-methyltransferase